MSFGVVKLTTSGFRAAAFLILAGAGMIAFQNCSNPPNVNSQSILESEASKIDFSYDANLDQITYMSCAPGEVGSFDKSAYFSFRVGSYRNGGLRLTDDFRALHGKKPAEKQSSLLWVSPANNQTSMQIAVRGLNDFRSVFSAGNSAAKGTDYTNIFETFGSSDLAEFLVNSDPANRIRYMRNGNVFGSRMEGSLYYTKNRPYADSIRKSLKSDAFLGLTFSQVASATGSTSSTTNALEYMPRGPADVAASQRAGVGSTLTGSNASSATQAYGRGYKLSFSAPTNGATPAQANFPDVVMRGVSEMNLLNPNDATGNGTWNCPESMRYRIVRPEDIKAGLVSCAMLPDPATLSGELAAVRNHLKTEDWYVDVGNRCIVAKKAPATCYGSQVKSVQYNITQACDNAGSDTNVCMHYASVCYKN